MGKRGPVPKPSAQKRIEGTYRKDRAARNEVVAPPGAPACPESMPDVALAKWNELVPILLERGTLSREDGAILEMHCRAYAMWTALQKRAERSPMVKTAWGPKVNPATSEARQWEARTTQTGDRLGLNASARSRVGKPESSRTPSAPADGTPLVGPGLRVIEGGERSGASGA